uniref:DUF1513 domain-containing protein n=1 Tax=Halomonas sp. TaxID=1486246 RepID=UPI0026039016|nr:DUF1513 domain-containing protein [Halomonas sp.]
MALDRQRRKILKLGLFKWGLGSLGASLAIGGTNLATAQWVLDNQENRRQWFFSAVDDLEGNHHLAGIHRDGSEHFLLPAPERCHGGCLHPHQPQAILFARRPGRHFHVLDARHHRELQSIDAGPGYHFYGHGVFDPSGRWLYVTANRLEDAMGLARVYDADANYAHHHDIELEGIGPHELKLMPDGDTLVIALGGIKTHPDSGRIKLNLDDMDPALLLVNRHSGEIQARHRPSHHQLSVRHLDVAENGGVIVGYQFEGPIWETHHPLVARLDPQGKFHEFDLGGLQPKLAQYTASVAVSQSQSGSSSSALITAPRGGRIVMLDQQSGEIIAAPELADAAGTRCDGQGGYIVTTGNGGLYQVSAQGELTQLAKLPLRWDNHLT